MFCLTPKRSKKKKKFPKLLEFLYGLHQRRPYLPWLHTMECLRKQNKCNFPSKYCVTLYRWSAKQTIPVSVLARNQTKGLDSRSRRDRKWVRERERSWTKELTEVSWQRVTRVASRHRTAERPVGWDRVQLQWGKTSQDESALLVVCRIFARNPR